MAKVIFQADIDESVKAARPDKILAALQQQFGGVDWSILPQPLAVDEYRMAAWREALSEKVEEAVSVGDGVTAATWQGHLNALNALLSAQPAPAERAHTKEISADAAFFAGRRFQQIVNSPAVHDSRDVFRCLGSELWPEVFRDIANDVKHVGLADKNSALVALQAAILARMPAPAEQTTGREG